MPSPFLMPELLKLISRDASLSPWYLTLSGGGHFRFTTATVFESLAHHHLNQRHTLGPFVVGSPESVIYNNSE